MNQTTLNALKQLLDSPKKICIVPHKNPDGDAIGSITALNGVLNSLGHQSQMISPNAFPDFLHWMTTTDEIVIFDKQADQASQLLADCDLLFILDFNAFHRAGDMENALSQVAREKVIMIDHHQQPDPIAAFEFSDISMSSTCEMVYHFLVGMNYTARITPLLAESLYTGIVTDTGSFKYRATTSATHRVAADLIDLGADNEAIHRRIYDVNSVSRMQLLGVALNNLVVHEKYRTAYISLTQEELDANDFKKGDTEGFVNYALSIENIVFALIFIENKQEKITKISLRSKANFDVNTFARDHFNGGGHLNAAGGRSLVNPEATIKNLISILPAYEKVLRDIDID